jgi:hypothetical protein
MALYKTADFDVVLEEDPFELRKYKNFITAKVKEDDLRGSHGFNLLFNYIGGSNEEGKKIAMTTPVINELLRDGITTEFVLPFDKLDSKFPEPKDDRITFKEYINESFAAIKFSGTVNEELIQEKMKLLFDWIKEKDYIPKGNVILARYNPPFIPGMFKRNEILISVDIEK